MNQSKAILAEFEVKVAQNADKLKKEVIMEESSSGSDSGKSEDDLEIEELVKVLPNKAKVSKRKIDRNKLVPARKKRRLSKNTRTVPWS